MKDALCRLFVLPVAVRHAGPLHEHFADAPLREPLSVFTENRDAMAG